MEPKRIKERRRFRRTPFVLRVDYQTTDAFFSDFSANINEGGMFIETAKPLQPDTAVRLDFKLPGTDRLLRVKGKVTWVRTDEDAQQGPPGVGIHFEDLPPETKEEINRIAKKLRSG